MPSQDVNVLVPTFSESLKLEVNCKRWRKEGKEPRNYVAHKGGKVNTRTRSRSRTRLTHTGKTSQPSVTLVRPSLGIPSFPKRLQDQPPLSGPSPPH